MKSFNIKLNIASKIFYSAIVSLAVFVIVFGIFVKFMFDAQTKFDRVINEEIPKVQLSDQAVDTLMMMNIEEKNILILSNTSNDLLIHTKQFEFYESRFSQAISLLKSKIHIQFNEISNIENEHNLYVANFYKLLNYIKTNKINEANSLSVKMKLNIENIRKELVKISAFNYQEIGKIVIEFDKHSDFIYKLSIVIVLSMIMIQMITAYSLFRYTRTKMKDIDEKINILQSRDFEDLDYEHQSLKDVVEFEKIEKTLVNTILMLASYDNVERLLKKSKEAKISLTAILTEKTSIEEICDSACDFIARHTNGSICAIYLVANNSDDLTVGGSYCLAKKEMMISSNDGVVGQVFKTQKSVFVSNLKNKENLLISGTAKIYLDNIYAYPIIFNKTCFGVFEISGSFHLNEYEQDFIYSSMEIIGYAIAHYKKLNEISCLLQKTEIQQVKLEQTNEVLIKNNDDLKTARLSLIDNNNRLNIALNEVNQKSHELEQSNKYKSEFLSNMSHELRTPLNSINILSNILSQNKSGNLSQKQVEQLLTIHRSGEDLLSLINDVLDFSKLESKMMQTYVEDINIKHEVKLLFETFYPVMREKEINFELKLCDVDPLNIKSDKSKIKQIIKNFLSNAMKFTSRGGSICLFLDFDSSSKKINIGVSDDGIGIDESKIEHIFLAFTQEDGSTSRRFGGTGLGLAICKNLANLIHSEISVKSKKDIGSTFILSLQFDENNSLNAKAEEQIIAHDVCSSFDIPTKEADSTKQLILLIEDDEHYANLIENEIAKLGFAYAIAQNGKSGIELAKKLKPDAILLDLALPVVDGVNVLKILKNDISLRHIPVKIISAGVKDLALESLGAVEFVEKTSEVNKIDDSIRTLINFANKKRKNILFIEDNDKVIQQLDDMIAGDDVDVLYAKNYEEAIAELKAKKFDCIGINITLDSFDACKLLELIKKIHCKLPVVAYSMTSFTPEQLSKIRNYSRHIVIKTAENDANIVEETSLFLHRLHSSMSDVQQDLLDKSFNTFDILNGKKILIVDDDPRNIFALDSIFENHNINVLHAFNGEEALKIIDEHQDISLVIMDIMMPVMDGYEATKRIRTQVRFNNLPIIALTARNDKVDRKKCIDSGASDYITKPVDATQLLQLAKIWIRG